jgi:oxygen-dependent protoporphyrinogen oxidase
MINHFKFQKVVKLNNCNSLSFQEQKYGGVIKGVFKSRKDIKFDPNAPVANTEFLNRAKIEGWSLYRMQDGIEMIPKKIVERLEQDENIEMNLSSPCEQITFKNDEVHMLINGSTHVSRHLISTLPSFTLAKLIEHQHPILAKELKAIQYVDVNVINLLYNNEDLLKEKGFGVLVAPSENLGVLGVIFDSCIVDSKNNTVLTVMSGGKWFDKWYGKDSSHEYVRKVALENISKILKIDEQPDVSEVHVNRQCIPQYVVGHHARVERIRKYIAENKLPISLGGAAFDGVGVNDVIMSSRNIVQQLSL